MVKLNNTKKGGDSQKDSKKDPKTKGNATSITKKKGKNTLGRRVADHISKSVATVIDDGAEFFKNWYTLPMKNLDTIIAHKKKAVSNFLKEYNKPIDDIVVEEVASKYTLSIDPVTGEKVLTLIKNKATEEEKK
jgi:hypothetical protein